MKSMKILICLATTVSVLLAACCTLHAQGFVAFHNLFADRITNALTGQPIFGTNNYRFGLYVGALGTPAQQLVMVGLATNRISASASDLQAGRFHGGNPFVLPWPYGDPGSNITFQVRGWSFEGGTSYEAAYANALAGDTGILLGRSELGWVHPGIGTQSAPILFGTLYGQVRGFALAPIPEPSAAALAGLGLAVLVIFRRRPQRYRDRGGT